MNRILEEREILNGIITPIEIEYKDKSPILVTDDYIEIMFQSKEPQSSLLSNLTHYEFEYFGNEVKSIEAVIQSLKYEEHSIRKEIYKYYGLDAWKARGMRPYAWQKDGILYTHNGAVDRFGEEYQTFLDQLYYFAYQNQFYRRNLKDTGNKKLDHVVRGENDTHKTTLTRTEYISRLYALRYCAHNRLNSEKEVMNVLKRVRLELK